MSGGRAGGGRARDGRERGRKISSRRLSGGRVRDGREGVGRMKGERKDCTVGLIVRYNPPHIKINCRRSVAFPSPFV